MTELSPELRQIGADLRQAYARRLRRRRAGRLTTAAVAFLVVAATATAAGTGDLQLDPTKWSILGGGSVDNGKAEYLHAKRLADGSPSTFMVEHDSGMDRYQAFLLHEKVVAEAKQTSPVPVSTEPGPLCTADQLTSIEQKALAALRANASPRDATAGEECRGRAYGIEIAQRVSSGVEPAADLMPGVR